MISEEIRQWLKQVKPVTKIQYLYLTTCQLTGSFVFGGYDPETSDKDVLMQPHVEPSFFGIDYLCYESGEYQKEEFRSFYVKDDEGVVFNLLFFNTDEWYEKWKWATDRMMDEVRRLSMNFADKTYRVETFERYKKEWEKNHG